MEFRLAAAFTLALSAAAGGAVAENEADFVYRTPLGTSAAFSGSMFTHSTEILTPHGIIDEPSTGFLLQQEPAAGPLGTSVPEIPELPTESEPSATEPTPAT